MGKANRVVGISAAKERDWQAEDDLRALMRAEEIKRDKARFARAQKMAKERLVEIAAVAGDSN